MQDTGRLGLHWRLVIYIDFPLTKISRFASASHGRELISAGLHECWIMQNHGYFIHRPSDIRSVHYAPFALTYMICLADLWTPKRPSKPRELSQWTFTGTR